MKETAIQRAILDYLCYRGIMCWRENNMASPLHGAGNKIVGFKHGDPHRKGIPDILGILPKTGRLIGIEVKSDIGKQSADQKLFQERMEKQGAIYILARSIDDVEAILRQFFT